MAFGKINFSTNSRPWWHSIDLKKTKFLNSESFFEQQKVSRMKIKIKIFITFQLHNVRNNARKNSFERNFLLLMLLNYFRKKFISFFSISKRVRIPLKFFFWWKIRRRRKIFQLTLKHLTTAVKFPICSTSSLKEYRKVPR